MRTGIVKRRNLDSPWCCARALRADKSKAIRPRKTQKEAAYLAAVLSSNLEELKQKLSDVKELERDISLCKSQV
jgi:hypothetical protein